MAIVFFPEQPQLLFHGVHREKRLIGLEQGIEAALTIGVQVFVITEQEKAISLEGFLAQLIELALLLSAQVVDAVVDEGHNVKAVKDDVDPGQALSDRMVVGTTHVHGYRLESFAFPGKRLKERANIIFAFSLDGMEDSPRRQVGNHSHVLMAFLDTELIDSDVTNLVERDAPIEDTQSGFVDVFDQVPSHPKIMCRRTDRTETEQVEDGERKRTHKPVLADHEGQVRPPDGLTTLALQAVKIQHQVALLTPNRAHHKPSGLLPLARGPSATTLGTPNELLGHLGVEDHRVRQVLSGLAANTLQPESMVQY